MSSNINYSIMKKIQLDGGTGISAGDDLLLETGEHMIQESPSEGIKISDISVNIYNDRMLLVILLQWWFLYVFYQENMMKFY